MTVYIVQQTMQRDPELGRNTLKPKFDFRPAEVYGDLEFLLPTNIKPWDTEKVMRQLIEGLEFFNGDEDYIIATGNPVLFSMAVAIAMNRSPRIRFLQYSGRPEPNYRVIDYQAATMLA